MAANKFASFLHKNTNKFTLILVYILLEWILIVLLLLNSLFSYFIIKFSEYFGLKTPCPMCTKLDHIFEPEKGNKFHRDLLCETHCMEISKLGYCSNHKKLTENENLCIECLFSERGKVDGFGEMGTKCSCCGLGLERDNYSPFLVIKPSLDIFRYTENDHQKDELFQYLMEQKEENQFISERNLDTFGCTNDDDHVEVKDNIKSDLLENSMSWCEKLDGSEKKDENKVICEGNYEEEKNKNYLFFGGKSEGKEAKLMMKDPSFADNMANIGDKKDVPVEVFSPHMDFFVGRGGYRLIPVELIDSAREENRKREEGDEISEIFGENFDIQEKSEDGFELNEEKDGDGCEKSEAVEMEENKKIVNFHHGDSKFWGFYNGNEEGSEREPTASSDKEELGSPVHEAEADVSIGTEIPDLEPTEIQNQECHLMGTSPYEVSSPDEILQNEINVVTHTEEEPQKLNTILIDGIHNVLNIKVQNGTELSDIEEEKIPDTPTSMDNLHHLHKKLLMLETREIGAEESLDGSVASELEGGDGISTTDELKSALKAERKALQTLYAELEEERSASAIAANQTMAMITRLQEEKAAMQMEALQYQRMMDEQSEYDQEALQLLNELMMKREKEKQELEKELEMYRKKVLEYEGKKKFRLLRKSIEESIKIETLSGSSSNNGDNDGLSMDLNIEEKEDDGFEHESGNHSTPIDEVLDSRNFEEERISILEQLRALEEKLFAMSTDEEEEHFEDIETIEHFYEENGIHSYGLENGLHKITNGKRHSEGRINGVKGKRLLPLFDEMSDDNEEKLENGHVNGYHTHELDSCNFGNGDSGNKRNGIEEEVVQLYDRLQALEEDREFLKHCISSLKKGDKGIELLQEILQHLRDLRNVDSLPEKALDDPSPGGFPA